MLISYLINKAKKTPYFHLDGYMNRYWLVPYTINDSANCGWVKWYKKPFSWLLQKMDIAIRVHEILTSDDDRALHCHPWPFISIILKGFYYEVMFNEYGDERTYLRKQGSILFRKATDKHRLILPSTIPVVTLFITFKKQKSWGFYPNPNMYINHRDYPKKLK